VLRCQVRPSIVRFWLWPIAGAAFIAGAVSVQAQFQPEVPSASDYGGVGLLDMRTARFLPDGYFSITGSIKNPDDRIAFTFQALPWLETTFRWSNNYAIRPFAGAGQGADRSFDFKVRLAQEGRYIPQIAVGLQDFAGTGNYAAEYLVASKQIGRLDFTLGLGWGRLASRGTFGNPLGIISNRFDSRSAGLGMGGTFSVGNYFSGKDVGLFGGVEYDTPIRNLRLQAEYSGDAYASELTASGRDFSFPVNFGVSYQAISWLNVRLSVMHGKEIGIRLATNTNPLSQSGRVDRAPPIRPRSEEYLNSQRRQDALAADLGPYSPQIIDLRPPAIEFELASPDDAAPGIYVATESAENTATGEASQLPDPNDVPIPLFVELIEQDVRVINMIRDGAVIRANIQNIDYRRDAETIARTVRVLSAGAPEEIESFELTILDRGLPITTLTFPRNTIDALGRSAANPAELWYATNIRPAAPEALESLTEFPTFGGFLSPVFRQNTFDPDNPIQVMLGASATGQIYFSESLEISGIVVQTLYDAFDTLRRTSNSVLPHVRSDLREYLKGTNTRIEYLGITKYQKLRPEIYARATAGILEWMFVGAGGEVLYRPFGQRWAVGANAWAVQQRGFEGFFQTRPYKTVTGHVSLYYKVPYHDLNVAIHGGRYLAGDYGATFEAFRGFSSGIKVGAWATFTNVPFSKFGEGSFDKGIRITIPFENFTPTGSRGIYDLALRLIQRDGGQMLSSPALLYNLTDSSSSGELARHWGSVFRR
jgi:hypothetical protein